MEPIFNMDDPVGKTVGRRKAPKDALSYALELNKTMNDLHRAMKVSPLPKGVFRFATHEEADEWWTKRLTPKILKS